MKFDCLDKTGEFDALDRIRMPQTSREDEADKNLNQEIGYNGTPNVSLQPYQSYYQNNNQSNPEMLNQNLVPRVQATNLSSHQQANACKEEEKLEHPTSLKTNADDPQKSLHLQMQRPPKQETALEIKPQQHSMGRSKSAGKFNTYDERNTFHNSLQKKLMNQIAQNTKSTSEVINKCKYQGGEKTEKEENKKPQDILAVINGISQNLEKLNQNQSVDYIGSRHNSNSQERNLNKSEYRISQNIVISGGHSFIKTVKDTVNKNPIEKTPDFIREKTPERLAFNPKLRRTNFDKNNKTKQNSNNKKTLAASKSQEKLSSHFLSRIKSESQMKVQKENSKEDLEIINKDENFIPSIQNKKPNLTSQKTVSKPTSKPTSIENPNYKTKKQHIEAIPTPKFRDEKTEKVSHFSPTSPKAPTQPNPSNQHPPIQNQTSSIKPHTFKQAPSNLTPAQAQAHPNLKYTPASSSEKSQPTKRHPSTSENTQLSKSLNKQPIFKNHRSPTPPPYASSSSNTHTHIYSRSHISTQNQDNDNTNQNNNQNSNQNTNQNTNYNENNNYNENSNYNNNENSNYNNNDDISDRNADKGDVENQNKNEHKFNRNIKFIQNAPFQPPKHPSPFTRKLKLRKTVNAHSQAEFASTNAEKSLRSSGNVNVQSSYQTIKYEGSAGSCGKKSPAQEGCVRVRGDSVSESQTIQIQKSASKYKIQLKPILQSSTPRKGEDSGDLGNQGNTSSQVVSDAKKYVLRNSAHAERPQNLGLRASFQPKIQYYTNSKKKPDARDRYEAVFYYYFYA